MLGRWRGMQWLNDASLRWLSCWWTSRLVIKRLTGWSKFKPEPALGSLWVKSGNTGAEHKRQLTDLRCATCVLVLKIAGTCAGGKISDTHAHTHTHTHTFSTYRWIDTKAKSKDNEAGSISSSERWETVRRNETSCNVDIYQACPRNTSRSSPQFPPSFCVFSLIVCGRRCSAMQLKHTRGWKTRLVFWNVLPLSAELCIPLQSIPAAHPGSVCGSGDNKGLCGQAEGRRQSVIGSLNSLAHSSGMPHVLAKTSFCFIQNSCKCAHSQQTTKHTHSLPLAVLPFLPAAFYLSHSHTYTHTHTNRAWHIKKQALTSSAFLNFCAASSHVWAE